MGLPLYIRIHHLTLFLLEPPPIRTLLVPIHRLYLIWLARNIRCGGSGGYFRLVVHGRRAGRGCARDARDVDHRACFADVLREAEESFGGGGEEIDGGDYGVCGEGFD